MAFNFMLPLRIAQFVLAVLVLGLNAFVASTVRNYPFYVQFSQINFLIFAAVWTAAIVVPFLILAPRFFPQAAHAYVIAAVEAVTMIFWFAGFIAQAVWVADAAVDCDADFCRCAEAATVFAALEWVLFTTTTVMAGMHVMRSRGGGAGKTNPVLSTQT